MSELIQYQIDANGIAVLCVNRPQARNALNWEMQEQFAAVVTAVAQEPAARVLIITGAGTGTGDQAFVSGGDLKELYLHPEREAGERLNRVMSNALAQLIELPIPVIGAINGDAFGGGCEIVTACDLRIATQHARFSFAQVKNGLTTGWGGAARLVHLVGQSRALELLLTARLFDAQIALEMGLIQRMTNADEDVFEAAVTWALDLVKLPRQALAAMKALTYAAGQQPLSKSKQVETLLFVDLWSTPDHLEALAAFREKRKPIFNQK